MFAYHFDRSVHLRQLFLQSNTRKRKSTPLALGYCFGAPLGSLTAFLCGRGIPNERKAVIEGIRRGLRTAAEGVLTMRGSDVQYLSLGMLSCKVENTQTKVLPELVRTSKHFRAESTIAVGCTAALVAAFSVMADVPNHARYIMHDESLLKSLRCAEQALAYWRGDGAHSAALHAEKRALERAILGARGVAEFAVQTAMNPTDALRLQLEVASACAYPKHALVDAHQQGVLLSFILQRNLAVTAGDTATPILPTNESVASAVASLGNVIPLSALPASALITELCERARDRDGGSSRSVSNVTTTSSWQSISAASRTSADSLSGVLEGLSGML